MAYYAFTFRKTKNGGDQMTATCTKLTETMINMVWEKIKQLLPGGEGKIRLAELEAALLEADPEIAAHTSSCVVNLINERGLIRWTDGEYTDAVGGKWSSDCFIEMSPLGVEMAAAEIAAEKQSEPEGAEMNTSVSLEVIGDEEIAHVLEVIKQILSDPEEADCPLYYSNVSRCARVDMGKSIVLLDILFTEGYIKISKHGIITMTEEQMKMEYPQVK